MSMETHKGVVALAFGMPPEVMSNVVIRETAHAAAWAMNAPIFTKYDCGIDSDDSPISVEIIEQKSGASHPPRSASAAPRQNGPQHTSSTSYTSSAHHRTYGGACATCNNPSEVAAASAPTVGRRVNCATATPPHSDSAKKARSGTPIAGGTGSFGMQF